MENRQELINEWINNVENRVNNVDKKVDDLEDKVGQIKDKNDERHLEMVKLTTELKGFSKSTDENTKRMANSIEGLVQELKQSSTTISQLNQEVCDVKSSIKNSQFDKSLTLERKKLSNGVLVTIIGGGFAVIEILIRVIAPILGFK
ncbi:hypothetical protein O0A22_11730 [Staphylococcus pseudintermedius]|nr:hypothetical protein [Staphylococcus pseudintermedius]